MFRNEYLDKLALNTYPDYLKELRQYAGLSREELADITGISASTIRRHESHWRHYRTPPKHYEMLLRFLCGDLSHFGQAWANCRIHPSDKKMINPYTPHTRMEPADMNAQYSRIWNDAQQKIREFEKQIAALEAHNKALAADNELLSVQLERLKNDNERLQLHKNSVKSGKVVPLFKQN